MRHKARCIIVTLDERMKAMQNSVKNNCLSRKDINMELERKIHSKFATKVDIDFSAINSWKAQFD